MTAAAQTPEISYQGDGSSTDFPIPFRYDAPSDLRALVRAADGSETILVNGTDFTASDGTLNGNGSITLNTAAAGETTLVVWRETALSQEIDLISNGAFKAETIEGGLDKGTLQTQEQAATLDRALKVPRGQSAPEFGSLDDLEVGTLIEWDGEKFNAVPYSQSRIAEAETQVSAAQTEIEALRDLLFSVQGATEFDSFANGIAGTAFGEAFYTIINNTLRRYLNGTSADEDDPTASIVLGPPLPQPPPFNVLAANAWAATVDDPTNLPSNIAQFQELGFDRTAAEVSRTASFLLATRIREEFPDHLTLTPNEMAFNDFAYRTHTIDGATNNSTAVSPKPNARWGMLRDQLVGDQIRVSIEAFHRNAQQQQAIACAQWRAHPVGGGTPTDWHIVGTPIQSTTCETPYKVEAFEDDWDISALPDGHYYLEGRLLPWAGDDVSIRSSEDADTLRDFERLYFTKNTVRAANPPIGAVSVTGDDATGVWSTDPVVARANPFATNVGAELAIYDAAHTAVTGGIADGCELWFGAGTHTLTATSAVFGKPQISAAFVYRRDPATASRDAVVLSHGSPGFKPNFGVLADRTAKSLAAPLTRSPIIFRDVKMFRAGAGSIGSTSASGGVTVDVLIQYHNVINDNNAQISRLHATTTVFSWVMGMVVENMAGNTAIFGGTANAGQIGFKGFDCADMQGAQFDGFSLAGCRLVNPGMLGFAVSADGFLISSSACLAVDGAVLSINYASSIICERMVLANFIGECIGTLESQPGLAICGDSGSTRSLIFHHVTITGARAAGRVNIGYDNQDNSANDEQSHDLMSVVGLYCPQLNIKGAIFRQDAAGDDGNFSAVHGVGWEAIYSSFSASAPTSEHPQFAGVNSVLGQSSADPTEPLTDLFDGYAGTNVSGGSVVAGAGQGTYTVKAGSPLLGKVTRSPVRRYDIAGIVRTGAQPVGAHA